MCIFFFNGPGSTEIYTVTLHDVLPTWTRTARRSMMTLTIMMSETDPGTGEVEIDETTVTAMTTAAAEVLGTESMMSPATTSRRPAARATSRRARPSHLPGVRWMTRTRKILRLPHGNLSSRFNSGSQNLKRRRNRVVARPATDRRAHV